jgi:hypothetical protein
MFVNQRQDLQNSANIFNFPASTDIYLQLLSYHIDQNRRFHDLDNIIFELTAISNHIGYTSFSLVFSKIVSATCARFDQLHKQIYIRFSAIILLDLSHHLILFI